jgi:hypothetical protein
MQTPIAHRKDHCHNLSGDNSGAFSDAGGLEYRQLLAGVA